MKKLLLVIAFFSGIIITQSTRAQVHLNVNIGSQPVWGPVGYDYVDYYYLPDIETYYYVPRRQFIYLNNGQWVFVSALPARYRSYNFYNGYKVVINEPRAYLKFSTHKVFYAKYKGGNRKQVIIRNSNDPKYFVIKGHPRYKPIVKTRPVGHAKNDAAIRVKNTTKPAGKSNSKGNLKSKSKQ